MQKKRKNNLLQIKRIAFKLIILLLICCLFYGCINRYEKSAIGYYEIEDYKLLDSSTSVVLPRLTLKYDKTFLAEFPNIKYSGEWKVNDIQEFTLIHFTFSDGHICEGRIDGTSINILNPQVDFYTPNLKTLSFKKIK